MDADGNYLEHYGIKRKSGRYPWGSGGTVEQRSKSFIDYVKQMLGMGLTEPQIAQGLGMTTTELRATRTIANAEKKAADIATATRLKYDRGMSNMKIGEQMGINESSVRALLAPGAMRKTEELRGTANFLYDQVKEKGFVDVGGGNENLLGISKTKLDTAIAILKADDYQVHTVQVPAGKNNKTYVRVLAPPGTTYRDIANNLDKIKPLQGWTEDGGKSYSSIQTPLSVNSKRVQVKYGEEGGADADGVIYIRPGVPDLNMGASRYAQVRIAIDGTHYLKGMAVLK